MAYSRTSLDVVSFHRGAEHGSDPFMLSGKTNNIHQSRCWLTIKVKLSNYSSEDCSNCWNTKGIEMGGVDSPFAVTTAIFTLQTIIGKNSCL